MKYNKINIDDVNFFKEIVGCNFILTDSTKLIDFSHDETEDLIFTPEIVIKPGNTKEISKIIVYCNQKLIPVTPCGARTGLSGGSLPILGGVVLSTERLNKIVNIDERNLQATVEPGVINQKFREAVNEKGLFYPPDPASKGSCYLGGNLAENAGGPKALKYGVTKDYVLNLQIVLPTGDIIWTGANVLKNSTGYNITQLMIGSEGTLGIVTKATLKLIPLPKYNKLILVPFSSAVDACSAVASIFKAGIVPSAMEFMDRNAVDYTIKYIEEAELEMSENVKALLLIEVDGNQPETLMGEILKVLEVVEAHNSDENILFAEDEAQKEKLWFIRRRIGEAVKVNSIYKEEDTVVPRYNLPELLSGVKEIGKKYGFESICYGHAGDGNLHVNIIKGDLTQKQWDNELPLAIREIFKLTVSLGGTISGEHGIGWVQKDYMDIAYQDIELNLMREIKKVFDPKNIMNPSKIF